MNVLLAGATKPELVKGIEIALEMIVMKQEASGFFSNYTVL